MQINTWSHERLELALSPQLPNYRANVSNIPDWSHS
jgi:hypothetical protein